MRGFEDYCWRDLLTPEMERIYSVNGNNMSTTFIAQYLDFSGSPYKTRLDDDGVAYNLIVTATIATYPQAVSETRSYEILPRLNNV